MTPTIDPNAQKLPDFGLSFWFLEASDGSLIKVRRDGRRGRAVGDEGALWLTLLAERQRVEDLLGQLAELKAERDELRSRLDRDTQAERAYGPRKGR